jgi:adenylosuccinate lyase
VLEFFHFACTSEDINNLAHGLMLKEAMNSAIFPVMDELIKAICNISKDNAHIPMLSRTHGQVICYVLHIISHLCITMLLISESLQH